MSQDGSWAERHRPPEEVVDYCLSDDGICNACGDADAELLSDGRCARCHQNTNPPHSWCSHPMKHPPSTT